MQLPITELVARYRVTSSFRLSFHSGSMLRGLLGRALRSRGCAVEPVCAEHCTRRGACTYSRLFDPPLPDPPPHRLLRGATHPPQPLLPIIPEPGARSLAVGELLELPLRILGRLDPADDRNLAAALEAVGELPLGNDLGRVTLHEVARVGGHDRVARLEPESTPVQGLTIDFETPTWITTKESRGRLPVPLTVPVLLQSVYRRLTIVCALYGSLEEQDEARVARLGAIAAGVQVTQDSLRPMSWERHSVERDQRHPMKGLLGSLQLRGELAELAGILRMAELVHVGKATSHGLGRIRVTLH